MPYTIQINSQLDGTTSKSYLVEVKPNAQVVTSPKLINAALFWKAIDCKPLLAQIEEIAEHISAITVEIDQNTPADLSAFQPML